MSSLQVKINRLPVLGATLFLGGVLAVSGCHSASHPDEKAAVYQALNQHNLRSVTVSQDRGKGVIKLTGIVGGNAQKSQAENVATAAAPDYRIENRLQVDQTGLVRKASPSAKPDTQTASK